MSVTGTPAWRSRPGMRRRVRRDRAQDLVVLATGQDRLDQIAVARERGRAASESGTRATSISAETPRRAAELGEIARKPVRHVHRGGRMRAHRFGQRHARLRQAIARNEMIRIAASSFQFRPCARAEPSAASPIVPLTNTWSPAFAPLRRTIVPRRQRAERRNRNADRPRRRIRVAAEQRTSIRVRIRAQPARESREPVLVEALRQRDRQQKAERRCALSPQDRRGSRAAPCGRRRRPDRRERNARPRSARRS